MKVIACTPTSNRRWAWNFSRTCMDMQIRKPDLWIIVDNSNTPAFDWSVAKDRADVLYDRVYGSHTIGSLRNRCLDLALENGADIVVFWDDDDYYPPTRISSGLDALDKNPEADIAASSKMYLLLTRENVLMTTGPFGDHHGTAATYTIRRRYVETHRFPDKPRGEEYWFTGKWTAKLAQVPAEDTIVVMGHGRNTVDKSDLLARPHVYKAEILNRDNGKMVMRSRWPVPWDTFRATFSAEAYGPPLANTPSVGQLLAEGQSPRIEDTGVSAEHRA
jgi:glycosyltransferase involved in cell wall biosynthesis